MSRRLLVFLSAAYKRFVVGCMMIDGSIYRLYTYFSSLQNDVTYKIWAFAFCHDCMEMKSLT